MYAVKGGHIDTVKVLMECEFLKYDLKNKVCAPLALALALPLSLCVLLFFLLNTKLPHPTVALAPVSSSHSNFVL